jgi:hypothetical protein
MTTQSIFYKAAFSSLAGLPISMILNQILIHWMGDVINTNEPWIAALIISYPFVIASVIRIFLIDYFYQRYNIDLSPEHQMGKLLKAIRDKLRYGRPPNLRC